MKLFHASQTPGIRVLEPRCSSHGRPLVYFSDRRENTLVYLSNAVEKFCRETGLPPQASYCKWGSYGFTKEGLLCLEEYWPDATLETYGGEAGYVYTVETEKALPLSQIPHAFVSEEAVEVTACEFVPDALAALKQAEQAGKLTLRSYTENSPEKLQWIEKSIRREYEKTDEFPYYQKFLKAKFQPFLETGQDILKGN